MNPQSHDTETAVRKFAERTSVLHTIVLRTVPFMLVVAPDGSMQESETPPHSLLLCLRRGTKKRTSGLVLQTRHLSTGIEEGLLSKRTTPGTACTTPPHLPK